MYAVYTITTELQSVGNYWIRLLQSAYFKQNLISLTESFIVNSITNTLNSFDDSNILADTNTKQHPLICPETLLLYGQHTLACLLILVNALCVLHKVNVFALARTHSCWQGRHGYVNGEWQ